MRPEVTRLQQTLLALRTPRFWWQMVVVPALIVAVVVVLVRLVWGLL